MDFLEQLYLNGYYPSENDRPQYTEYKLACKRAQEYEERIIKALGDKFMDRYYSAKSEQVSMELAHAYAQGVAFAINLFLSGKIKDTDLG